LISAEHCDTGRKDPALSLSFRLVFFAHTALSGEKQKKRLRAAIHGNAITHLGQRTWLVPHCRFPAPFSFLLHTSGVERNRPFVADRIRRARNGSQTTHHPFRKKNVRGGINFWDPQQHKPTHAFLVGRKTCRVRALVLALSLCGAAVVDLVRCVFVAFPHTPCSACVSLAPKNVPVLFFHPFVESLQLCEDGQCMKSYGKSHLSQLVVKLQRCMVMLSPLP